MVSSLIRFWSFFMRLLTSRIRLGQAGLAQTELELPKPLALPRAQLNPVLLVDPRRDVLPSQVHRHAGVVRRRSQHPIDALHLLLVQTVPAVRAARFLAIPPVRAAQSDAPSTPPNALHHPVGSHQSTARHAVQFRSLDRTGSRTPSRTTCATKPGIGAEGLARRGVFGLVNACRARAVRQGR
jgi:hypothetical protein